MPRTNEYEMKMNETNEKLLRTSLWLISSSLRLHMCDVLDKLEKLHKCMMQKKKGLFTGIANI